MSQFTNAVIEVNDLPRAEEVVLQKVHPAYLRTLQITWGIIFLLLLGVLITIYILVKPLHNFWAIGIGLGAYTILLLVTTWIIRLSYRIKEYAVREKDVLYRTGWLIQRFHLVPFNRMQHCVVEAGPIDRKYGLASISIYTAASEGKDITIHGLPLADAEKLKELIISHIQPLQHEPAV